jgi:HlyD family secretion protein
MMKSLAVPSPRSRPWLRKPFLAAYALLLGGLLAWAFFGRGSDEAQTRECYEVKRDDFLISIVEGGNLRAVNEISVRNEVDGVSRIIYIVPEGSYVKKGDLLVKLDSSGAEDQVNLQQIATEKAQSAYVQAQEQLAIQKSQADSDIRAAEIKLELAQIDLDKFKKGEVIQKRRELELQIGTIEEKLAIDQDTLKWTEELFQQGFETKSTLDKHKLAVSGSLMNLQQATNALWMWEAFDYHKQLTDYKSKVEEAQKELERVKHQAKSKLAQFEVEERTAKSTLELNQSKLLRDTKNMQNANIYAPADGLVVYASNESRFSSESLIEEGASVRNRQELIKLPDTSQMKVAIKIHESHVSKVKPGLPAFVMLDNMPDKRFQGYVSKVALLPDSQSRWGNPDLKVYNTEILITDKLPDSVKPGVSASAEILITNLLDVLKIPVQSVTTYKGKPVVYLAGAESKPVPVEVGLFNTKFIEVTSGLQEGDQVLLSPPFDSQSSDLGGSLIEPGQSVPTNAAPVPIAAAELPPQANSRPADADTATASRAGPAENGPGRRGNRGGFNREEMLKRFDKNGDGQLDEAEQTALRAAFPRRRGGPAAGDRSGGTPETGTPRASGDISGERPAGSPRSQSGKSE